ncbi:DUF732 domain-containing protein [Mycobacterium sp. THU-M104]|uniref:DUF732 domain-containing protein n=2 Tax=unclassified Mycobacterium TaxID=2642494 RepID=UPI003B9B36FF
MTRKLLTASVGLATVLALAPLAHADSEDDDSAAFLATIRKAGIAYKDPGRAVKAGQAVCGLAGAGTSEPEILRDIRDLNPGFTLDGAAKFAEAAALSFCPEQLGDGSGNAKNR